MSTQRTIQERFEIMLDAIERDDENDPEYDDRMILEFLCEIEFSDLSENAIRPMRRAIMNAWYN